MDVRADESGLRPDPYATATFQRSAATGPVPAVDGRSRASGQCQLFSDPTYADTDKIPAVPSDRGRRPGPARWLRVMVAVVALVVVAAGVTLALVQTGVIGKTSPSRSSGAPAPATHRSTATVPTAAPLVTQISTGAGTATYQIDVAVYTITVTTSTGRSWVSVGPTGKAPAYEGILAPNSSQKEILLGPSQVEIGAGGTRVVVSSGRGSVTLTPPSAPFSYQFVLKG